MYLYCVTQLSSNLRSGKIFALVFNEFRLLTGECPKVFGDFGVRKRVEKWQFSDKLGRIDFGLKRFIYV